MAIVPAAVSPNTVAVATTPEAKRATTTTGAAPAAGSTTGTSPSPATSVPAETPASVAPLPRAEFVEKANAVCRRLDSALRPILASAKTEDDLATVVPKMARAYEAALRGMVAIGPPEALARRFRAFTRTTAGQVETLSRTPTKAGVLAQLQRVSDLSRRNTKLARRLGLTACVNVGQRRYRLRSLSRDGWTRLGSPGIFG